MEHNAAAIVVRFPALAPVVEHAGPPAAGVYLASLAQGSRRTMRGALDTIAKLFAPALDALTFPWSALRAEHTAAIRSALVERFAPSTANKMLAALRGVLRAAWRLGRMTSEAFARAVDVKGATGSRLPAGRALSAGEIRTLFLACSKDATTGARLDAALLALMFGAGLRRAEVVALEVDNWNTEAGELRVRGKGNRERLVPIFNGTADALAAWLDVRGAGAGPMFCPVHRSGRIVVRRMSAQAIYTRLARRAEAAGVASFSPHDLRRSFVSDLLDAGADIAAVQRLAGHASIATTTRYDRRGEAAKRKAASLLHVPFVPLA